VSGLKDIYRPSLALLTDLYELTMAYGYWKLQRLDEEAVFHLSFRECPFGSGYAVAAGLEFAVDYLTSLHFDADDLAYLATLNGADDTPLFEPAFLDYLHGLTITLDVDAIPEGTVVFAHQPLIQVKGPLLQCQIVETALLNIINFQTLIATKAARVCQAARGQPVLEFGLRRAQGIDGALAAGRAAYIGGCAATSNLLAGRLFGIPVKGTHAHSWIMSFPDERNAFDAYAKVMPHNCVFLVDTYDTLQGVRHAVEAARLLRAHGRRMLGIRLDSGDLTYLSTEARKLLDEAGFPDALILGTNDLDEHIIASLKDQGAAITVWGVGTRLVTADGCSALGGVYKLAAIRRPGEPWQYKVKLSEQTSKINIPGLLQVRRFTDAGRFVADMTWDLLSPMPAQPWIIDPTDPTHRKHIDTPNQHEDLLIPVFESGKRVYTSPPLADIRNRTAAQLDRLHPGIRRFLNPHRYPAGLEQGLFDLRQRLILEARGFEKGSRNLFC